MRATAYIPLFGALLLAGCANWNTVYRQTSLGDAKGIVLDVKTRAILASPREADGIKTNVICPEASPDALSVASISAAVSGALERPSGTSPTEAQLKAAATIAEGAASIGLRTQSIQLMRDGLVYNCLLFMNGAVSPAEAYLLQRRSQNFTLGLLAIEQLTGPVKAQQAALTAQGAASQGTSDVQKEADMLAAKQAEHTSAKAARERDELELKPLLEQETVEKAKVEDAQKAYEAAVKTASGKPDDSEEKKAEKEKLKTLTEAQEARKAKTTEVENKRINGKELAGKETAAELQVRIAREALENAQSRVRASTHATAVLASSGGSHVIITDKIAGSVVDIVKAVLAESGAGEACNSIRYKWVGEVLGEAQSVSLQNAILELCPLSVARETLESNTPTARGNSQRANAFRTLNRLPAVPQLR